MTKAQKIVLWGPEERDGALRLIGALKLDQGRPWMVVVKRHYESPSERQRGYYRSVVLHVLSDHTGYTEDEVHEYLKKKFGPKARIEIDGEAHDVVTFTTSDEGEIAAMSVYIDQIIRWAAMDLGVYIPPAREKWARAA